MMSRRWAPPKPKSTQIDLRLEQRGRFTAPIKLATDTSAASAASVGLKRGGDIEERREMSEERGGGGPLSSSFSPISSVAAFMVGVLERHTAKVRLGGAMLALTVRKEVFNYLSIHPDGATADEIAAALRRTPFTVRPRCSELLRKGLIADSGRRRENVSRRSAIVWIVSPFPPEQSE